MKLPETPCVVKLEVGSLYNHFSNASNSPINASYFFKVLSLLTDNEPELEPLILFNAFNLVS